MPSDQHGAWNTADANNLELTQPSQIQAKQVPRVLRFLVSGG